jgi:hypothetical protein
VGETVEATLTEIQQTRAAVERDVDELMNRLPAREQVVDQAKTYGGAAVGALALMAVIVSRVRSRSEKKAKRERARINAEELARVFSPHTIDDVGSDRDDGGSRTGAFALAVALAALGLGIANSLLRERDE